MKVRLFSLLILTSASVSTTYASERFNIPGRSYSVSFSGTPDCAVQNVDTPAGPIARHSCAYYDKDLGGGYTFEYFTLPIAPHMSKVQHLLRATAAGAAGATDSEIIRERQILVDGHPALETLFLTKSKGLLTHAIYVLVGSDLVTVSVDGGKRIHDSTSATAFLKSLMLSKVPAHDADKGSSKPTPQS